ncbi:MAG: hypothetical protein IKQ09_03090 [Bacteroidales bacterium]|nr:hypothetical protein [Bacteroidales bacterium]
MKINLKTIIATTLVFLTVIFTFSCKKNKVEKVAVDSQFAIALFSDTVALRQIINDMDSTTQNWLRVRNDSIFVFYVDTIKNVLKASDLLSDIEDVSFNTSTGFAMPPFDPTNNHDTVIDVDRFMTVPFHYDGYNIEEVLLRGGNLNFNFVVTPQIEQLKQIEIYSNQILSPEGEPLVIIDDGRPSVDLSNYHVIPEQDTVAFGARVTIHVDHGVYDGGDYTCDLTGGLTGVKFKTVHGTIDKPLDSIYNDQTAIDFGIAGLSGSAVLPIPTINLDYSNTFGFGARADVTELQFVNENTGLVTNLLASDVVEVTVNPTEGEWYHTRIDGLTETIDALAGYTRLDFAGEVTMNLNPGNAFSISDTSTVDIAADIEMPFSFKLSDLCYNDTIAIDLSGSGDAANQIDDYIDEIEFFIDYNSKIKIDVDLQGIFMKNNTVIDSLFNNDHVIYYSADDNISTISVTVTGQKLRNVLRANQMILRLGVSTEAISPDPVQLMDTDAIFMRMRVLTKTSEINIGGNN